MDYSFGNAHVEVEKNFTKNEQVKATVKAVADNPNVRREGTLKYHQAMDSELLEVWRDPRAQHLKPFRLLGITIQQ